MTGKKTWTILFLWLIGVATGVFFLAEWQYGDVWTFLTMRAQSSASSLNSRRQQSDSLNAPAALAVPAAQIEAVASAETLYSQALRLQTGSGVK